MLSVKRKKRRQQQAPGPEETAGSSSAKLAVTRELEEWPAGRIGRGEPSAPPVEDESQSTSQDLSMELGPRMPERWKPRREQAAAPDPQAPAAAVLASLMPVQSASPAVAPPVAHADAGTQSAGTQMQTIHGEVPLHNKEPFLTGSTSFYFKQLDSVPSDSELHLDEEPPAQLTDVPQLKGFLFESFTDAATEASYLNDQFRGMFRGWMLVHALWFLLAVVNANEDRPSVNHPFSPGITVSMGMASGTPAIVGYLDGALCLLSASVRLYYHISGQESDRERIRCCWVLFCASTPAPLLQSFLLNAEASHAARVREISHPWAKQMNDIQTIWYLVILSFFLTMSLPGYVAIPVVTIGLLPSWRFMAFRSPSADAATERVLFTIDALLLASGVLGILLAQLVQRFHRRSFAAHVHSQRLLSLRIDQLCAEKERLDYERRIALSKLPRTWAALSRRTASSRGSSHSDNKQKQRAVNKSCSSMVNRSSTTDSSLVHGATLFAKLAKHRHPSLGALQPSQAQEEGAGGRSCPLSSCGARTPSRLAGAEWRDNGSSSPAPGDSSDAGDDVKRLRLDLSEYDHVADPVEGQEKETARVPTSATFCDLLALV